MYRRILLPTDGSPASHRAVLAGVGLARSIGAELVGMTAMADLKTLSPDMATAEQLRREYEASSRANAQRRLDEVASAARAAGVACKCDLVNADNPYEAIIASANANGCDLIVMASHGRHGFKGLLLGSETQKVLVHSNIPVMVHRDREMLAEQ